MKKFSELHIIFSNCLSGGTAWNEITSQLVENLYEEMTSVEGLEFKKINSNTVRGQHNSFTLSLFGVFYKFKTKHVHNSTSLLLEQIRNATNKIKELTYTEIRVEHTRHLSNFSISHDILNKMRQAL